MRIGLKNKFFISFHILLSGLLLGLSSFTYAMSKSEAFEYCRDNCGYSSYFNVNSTSDNGNTLLTYNSYLQYLDNQPQNYYIVLHENGSDHFDVLFKDLIEYNNTTYNMYQSSNRSGQTTKYWYSFNFYYNTTGYNGNAGNSLNNTFPSGGNSFYMIYGNGKILKASFSVPPAINFDAGNDIISVGNYNNVHLIYWWPTTYITWGIISGYNEIDTSLLNYALIRVYPNGDEEVVINPFIEPWYLISVGEYYWESSQRRIYTNSLYKLLIDYDGDIQTFYFYVVPRGSSIVSGSSIPFTWNSGDAVYNIQNQTNDLINAQKSGDDKIIEALTDASEIDSILSGEFTSNSGDIKVYAEKFGFTPLDNPFTTFLIHILDNIFDALTEPNNVVLSADYKNLHFELNSDDFTTPTSPAKDFIRNLLIFLYIYGNYRFFNHLLVLIQTAKIDKAIATLGTDEFYDSDIM